MTPDELRALADALHDASASLNGTHFVAARKAAAYLRAQADAQPTPAVPQADAQPVAAVPVDWMERLKEAVKHIGYANVEKWYRLGGEDMIEQAKSDAVTAYATLCEALESLYAAPAAPQAEPKREAMSEELLPARVGQPLTMTIATDEPDGGHWYSPDFVRERIRAAYERAAQECIETAAELRRCADGCTDGRYDWKADGALDCAAAIRALGRQHD